MEYQLGALLRQLRDAAELTQEQVAERSGVSVRTVRRLESGQSTNPHVETVKLLSDALELDDEDRHRLSTVLDRPRKSQLPQAANSGGGTRPSDPSPGGGESLPVNSALAGSALELAAEVKRRWRAEEAHQRVHDPFPLPVRWVSAPADLTDSAENIQRLDPGQEPSEMEMAGGLPDVAEFFLRVPSRRLVVIGRAGSGKSVLAIRFVLDFLESARAPGPVPVVFSIGSWDPTTTALRDWMVSLLLRDHSHLARRGPRGTSLAEALVDADLILPVLDGFDEIGDGLREAALASLNVTSVPLVLTTRRGEFADAVRAARAPLLWAAGIELTDLSLDDLTDYLPRTARPATHRDGSALWDPILRELREQTTTGGANLAAVLTTPLMVALVRTLYSEASDNDPAELLDASRFATVSSLEEYLLAGFLPAVYRRRAAPERGLSGQRSAGWDRAHAERGLGYLARHLNRLGPDRRDLAWWRLGESLPRASRTVMVAAASALCVTFAFWLAGLVYAALFQLSGLKLGELLVQGCLVGPVAGLAFGSLYAITDAARGGAAYEPSHVRLSLRGARARLGRRPVRTFAVRFGHGLVGGTILGIGCAWALTLERALYLGSPLADPKVIEHTLINMVFYGFVFGSTAGLLYGCMAALETPVDVTEAATPIGLLSANRSMVGRQFAVTAVALTFAVTLNGILAVQLLRGTVGPLNWGWRDGLFVGSVCGLGGAAAHVLGFTAWGQWLLLARIRLPLAGRLPWRIAGFLDDAYHRGALRQRGAVYQFRHVRLQQHLGGASPHHRVNQEVRADRA
ncbi:NACHT domain-containing protein [Actinocorallia lasiicapitis]